MVVPGGRHFGGGGVSVPGNGSTFTMNDGKISGKE
jgi:hypothetical protein